MWWRILKEVEEEKKENKRKKEKKERKIKKEDGKEEKEREEEEQQEEGKGVITWGLVLFRVEIVRLRWLPCRSWKNEME